MIKTLSYQLFKKIRAQLMDPFLDEAGSIAFIIVEYFSGLSKTDILIDKVFTTDPQFESKIQSIINRLHKNEPIQYILGKAYFYNRPFLVDKSTLIPRQETEELVYLVLSAIKNDTNLSILDIGTGTGCIPITLALETSSHSFTGIDISEDTLKIAKKNASQLGANIEFKLVDILNGTLSHNYNIIISNPPYVLEGEKKLMKDNVLIYEPQAALFVNNTNPLLFYDRITKLAAKHLDKNGRLYFEINEQFGKEVKKLLVNHSFKQVKLLQDLNGKDRFVSGVLG